MLYIFNIHGSFRDAQEMAYIVRHSGSCGIIAQDSATLERLAPALAQGAHSSNGSNGSNGSGSHVSPAHMNAAYPSRSRVAAACHLLDL